MYTIKEVAEKMDISEHTIRFWAKNGKNVMKII